MLWRPLKRKVAWLWLGGLWGLGSLWGGNGTALAQPSNCRLYLVEQYNWGAKQGFYLDLEGSELARLPVILGLGDGQQWRFGSYVPPFAYDRAYRLQAILEPRQAEVRLEGQPIIRLSGAWRPAEETALIVNNKPAWANEPGDWLGIMPEAHIAVKRGGREIVRQDFDMRGWASLPPALHLFERGYPHRAPLRLQTGDTVEISLLLRFEKSDPRAYAPLIDRFGQARAAQFPGKITQEAELQADIAAEEAELKKLPPLTEFDAYGGLKTAPWREKATGFFRVVHREGMYWLITPEGNPCFYTGICLVPGLTWETTPITGREYVFEWLPPKEGLFAAAWSRNQWGIQDNTEYCCFYAANLIRKYGADWQQRATAQAYKRLRAFGLQGGKWGCGVPLAQTPVLHRWEAPNLVSHPDIFDEKVRARLRESLEKQITPRKQDPFIVGWSFGNEYDEIIKREEVRRILQMPPETPARRALVEYALRELYGGEWGKLTQAWKIPAAGEEARPPEPLHVPEEDLEKMRLYYEARYHEFVYRTVKELDPNHLYLGFWIVPSWWESPQDWDIAAAYCDVLGYDRYAPRFADEGLRELFRRANKPVLCGEFSHPAWYGGARGFGRYGTYAEDEAEAGRLYTEWVREAAQNPYCVGLIWFLYRDQPLTGRGPGRGDQLVYGEHFAFGIVTEQDRVKWPLVRAMRAANQQAARWRLHAPSPAIY